MIDWLSERYLDLVLNYRILLGNPTQCGTVELLRLFSLTLLVVLGLRIALHTVVFYGLRRRFPRYDGGSHPRLIAIYHALAKRMGLRRTPALHRFFDRRPLVFTIGSLSPSIFIAPALVEHLPEEELRAVLVHELTHIKRHDGVLLWLMELLFLSIPLLIVQVAALSFIFSVQGSALALLGALTAAFLFRSILLRSVVHLRELSCDDLSVDMLRDPLLLASSLISVCQLGRNYPPHRWTHALAFTKNFSARRGGVERRVRRLVNYRRPRFKFVAGRVLRFAFAVLVVVSIGFVIRVQATHDDLDKEIRDRAPSVVRINVCDQAN